MLGGGVGRYISYYHKNLKMKLAAECKTFSNEIEIFESTEEKTKNIKLLFNSLKTIPSTFAEWERTEHDWTILVLNIFVS